MRIHIAKLLLKDDIVTKEQVKEAVEKAQSSNMELSEALIELGYLSESELLNFLGNKFGVPVISIEDHSIDQDVLKLIPREMAIENQLIPLSITGSALTVAMSDPSNIIITDELSFLTEKNIIPVVVSENSIIDKLKEYYGYSERKKYSSGNQDIELHKILNEFDEFNTAGKVDDVDSAYTQPGLDDNLKVESTQELPDAFNPQAEPEISEVEPSQDIENEFNVQAVDSQEKISAIKHDPVIFNKPENEPETSFPQDNLNNSSASEEVVMDIETSNENVEPQMTTLIESSVSTVKDIETSSDVVEDFSVKPSSGKIDTTEVSQRVLVIDNSRTVQKLISLSLERSGYQVSSVSDGMEALSCLSDFKPTLIFLDIDLFNMDGYRVCKIIKSHALMKKVPIVMISGKDGLVDKMRTKMAGADGYLSKPFGLTDIKDTANRYTEMASGRLVSGQD